MGSVNRTNISLKSILDDNRTPNVNLQAIINNNCTLPRRNKRRAPLPPSFNGERRTAEIPKTYQKNEPIEHLQIIEDYGDLKNSKILNSIDSGQRKTDFDLNNQLDELTTIAKCFNNLEKKYLESKNPFDDDEDYDESKNPFNEDEKNPFMDKTNPFDSDDEYTQNKNSNNAKHTHLVNFKRSEIIPKERSTSIELRTNGLSNGAPKRTSSVQANGDVETSVPLRRNDVTRYSMRSSNENQKENNMPRLSRTNSENNHDPLGPLKKQWMRASAKFRREPLDNSGKNSPKPRTKPLIHKQIVDIKVNDLKKNIFFFLLCGV